MAKVVWAALLAAFIVLVVLAGLFPPVEPPMEAMPRPVEVQVERVLPEPRPEPVRAEQPVSPVAEQPQNVAPQFGELRPAEVLFWVNEIGVPPYQETFYSFIPIEESDVKTFAGRFGPYAVDPREWLRVDLCAEQYKIPAGPACMPVVLSFDGTYASFAVGLQHDEYVGGLAAKDYLAYYIVRSGEAVVAESNRAVVRTVKD